MRNRINIKELFVATLLSSAAILLAFSISVGNRMSNPDTVAQRLSKALEKRMDSTVQSAALPTKAPVT